MSVTHIITTRSGELISYVGEGWDDTIAAAEDMIREVIRTSPETADRLTGWVVTALPPGSEPQLPPGWPLG